jgi:hypothetical protein
VRSDAYTYICWDFLNSQTYTMKPLVQLHMLLIKSPVSSWFPANLTSCFGHTGPSSGIYDDLHKLLYCTTEEQRSRRVYISKVYYLNNSFWKLKFSTQTLFRTLKRCKLVYCVSLHSIFFYFYFRFSQRYVFRGWCPDYACSVRQRGMWYINIAIVVIIIIIIIQILIELTPEYFQLHIFG